MTRFDHTVQATSGSAAASCSVTPSGNRHHLAGGHGDVLGIASAGQQSANLLPDGPAGDAVADRGDRSGHLQPEGLAGSRRRRVVTRGLQQVGAVDAGGADLDQDFAGGRRDVGNFLPGQLTADSATIACIRITLLACGNTLIVPTPAMPLRFTIGAMEGIIAGRTASDMPGLDIAEQRSWQNFLDSALRMYATLNRSLVDEHHLTLNDVRLLDILDKSATASSRMGDLADGLMSLPSRVTRQIRRLELQGWCAAAPAPTTAAECWPPSPTRAGRAVARGDGDLRRGRAGALPRPAVAAADRGDGGELQADQRGAEGRGAAGENRPRLSVCRRQRTPRTLSAVAWQSGLMHSP